MVNLAENRQRGILKSLTESGSVIISTIAAELNVSEMTIRRDLKVMEEQGLVKRVHGGAVAPQEARFGTRLIKDATIKSKAAGKLVDYIPESGTIYLDGSTTILNMVDNLKKANGLQVVTNNIETFTRLAEIKGIEPIMVAGKLDRRTDNIVGSLALRSIMALAFDAAFFSCWGISSNLGNTEATIEDAEVKELVAGRAEKVFIAIDENKLEVKGSGVWASDKSKTILATNLNPQDEKLEKFINNYSTVI
jgi:DeoR/GlpR family transcriptional regulator of sugar metabolism